MGVVTWTKVGNLALTKLPNVLMRTPKLLISMEMVAWKGMKSNKLSSFPNPIWKKREKYLAEIAKFKDMVRDCDVDKTDSNGEITNEEGLQCLQQFPKHKEVFEDADENKDGNLVKDELRNHVSRVRAKNYVADGHHRRQPHGPTTPMN